MTLITAAAKEYSTLPLAAETGPRSHSVKYPRRLVYRRTQRISQVVEPEMMGGMLIRNAVPEDWPQVWRFMQPIVAAGETFTWDPAISEEEAQRTWFHEPKVGRTLVAVDGDGAIIGTAEIHRNQSGPGGHVANAGFMVDPAHEGRGVGRALVNRVLEAARVDGYRAMQFNAVVETNTNAVGLWQSVGFEVMTTIPEAFHHPAKGYVGLHVMHRRLMGVRL
jgi:GNAT superfamily N-acetyltransferase